CFLFFVNGNLIGMLNPPVRFFHLSIIYYNPTTCRQLHKEVIKIMKSANARGDTTSIRQPLQ
ncbi:hypothetical protein, partial [Halobacillus sp. BBL2006]|uniref:hypothetical protein n=1 Tax=Halobacillus sp. BBL2006 TaxID=1543706 RepID=UPI001E495414